MNDAAKKSGTGNTPFDQAIDEIEGRTGASDKPDLSPSKLRPAAGPHAKPELTNATSTPGAGVLPLVDEKNVEAGTG
jgi:hypothetical protein